MLPAEPERVTAAPSTVSFGPFIVRSHERPVASGITRSRRCRRACSASSSCSLARAGAIVSRQDHHRRGLEGCVRHRHVAGRSDQRAAPGAWATTRSRPSYIQTVHRRGYRFVAPVTDSRHFRRLGHDRALPAVNDQADSLSAGSSCRGESLRCHWCWPGSPSGSTRIFAPRHAGRADAHRTGLRNGVRRSCAGARVVADGRILAWSACDSPAGSTSRSLDQLDPQAVPGTEDASAPFFSPDGRWLAFFAGGKLRKVARRRRHAGRRRRSIADVRRGLAAGRRHHICSLGPRRTHAGQRSGGGIEQLTLPSAEAGEVRHSWPALAPGGRALLFTVATSPGTSPRPHRDDAARAA